MKDADALDRVRLKYDGLDPKYLRTEEARKMVLAAYEVFDNYRRIEYEVNGDKK